ncbi:MAG: hypothetical protein JWQ35_2753 [Bacteriovoracaceae bacterium]|nr:hypothetical protein [Bacteriovoracaceae bacterium]
MSSQMLSAHSIESETSIGKNQFGEEVTYSGKKKLDSGEKFNWNGGFDYTKSSTITSGVKLKDNTYTFTGGLGVKKIWKIGISGNYSLSPAEKLQSFGPSFYASKDFDLRKPASPEAFVPTLMPRFSFALERYYQKYAAGVTRKKSSLRKVAGGVNSLYQFAPGFSLDSTVLEWLDISAGVKHYWYSRNVNHFLTQLDSAAALKKKTSQFSDTLSSLPDNSVDTEITFHPLDALEIELDGELLRLASDKSWSKTLRFSSTYDVAKAISFGASYERDFGSSAGNIYAGNLIVNF